MMDKARIKAIAVLGYNFNVHMLKSVFTRGKGSQAELFKSYFRDDRIGALTEEEYDLLPAFERCVSCGLCPAHCRVMELAGGRFKGPMHIADSASRNHPDFIHDLDSLLLCAACGQCEPVCPEGVPVSRMVRAMREMVWRVAPESLPNAYHAAGESLRAGKTVYGPIADVKLPKKPDAEAAFVPGPHELALAPERASRAAAVLERLGYDLTCVVTAGAGGVAEAMGIEPDTAWIAELAASPARVVILSDPETWRAISRDKRLADKRVMFISDAIAEKWPEDLNLDGAIIGPATIHDPYPLARQSAQWKRVRVLLGRAGVELIEMDPCGEYAPPLGWEGGLGLIDPELAARLAEARMADTKRAGAKAVLTLCSADASSLEPLAAGDLAALHLIDIIHKVLF